MRVNLIAHTVIMEDVPDYIHHNYFGYTTHTDDLGEQAGRLCYLSWDRPNPKTATNQGYMANIIEQAHFSVTGHASATFYIDGVTRNFTHELIRHSHFRYSEVSQRYCDVGEFAFAVHPGLADIGEEANRDLIAAIEAGKKAYRSIMKDLTEKGKDRKQARQAARHALVSGTETKILVSGNMQAWRDMLWKRLVTKEDGEPLADLEFYLVAKEILAQLKGIAPNTFQDFED